MSQRQARGRGRAYAPRDLVRESRQRLGARRRRDLLPPVRLPLSRTRATFSRYPIPPHPHGTAREDRTRCRPKSCMRVEAAGAAVRFPCPCSAAHMQVEGSWLRLRRAIMSHVHAALSVSLRSHGLIPASPSTQFKRSRAAQSGLDECSASEWARDPCPASRARGPENRWSAAPSPRPPPRQLPDALFGIPALRRSVGSAKTHVLS